MRLPMKSVKLILVAGLLTATLGCAGMTATQQRVLSGTALGTAAGVGAAALLGGSLAVGAVTGAAAGAVGGVIVDGMEKSR